MRAVKSPAGELLRALRAALTPFDGTVEAEELVSTDWASVTFSGARHQLRLRIEGDGAGEAAGRLLSGLSERDFALSGHVLADIVAVSDERLDGGRVVRLRLEALTVEE